MSTLKLSLIDIVLVAICLFLLLISGLSVFLLLRLRKQNKELSKNLELQKSRVLARKEKIMELRKKMKDLVIRFSEDEQKLLTSYTQEEIATVYPEIIDALRNLLSAVEVNRLPQGKQANVMSAAIKLSHQLQEAFRMPEEPLLEQKEDKQEGEAANDSIVPRRALIVDDNEESLLLSAEVVESSGFLVDLAKSGEEAVNKVRISREGYYDLILMDVIMPGKSGYETCRDIRKLMRADCDRIPVIALAANNFSEDYAQLIDSGMNDRLSKPISRDSFLSMVSKWLQRHEADTKKSSDVITWTSISNADGTPAEAK